jgi:hypothetical protein
MSKWSKIDPHIMEEISNSSGLILKMSSGFNESIESGFSAKGNFLLKSFNKTKAAPIYAFIISDLSYTFAFSSIRLPIGVSLHS